MVKLSYERNLLEVAKSIVGHYDDNLFIVINGFKFQYSPKEYNKMELEVILISFDTTLINEIYKQFKVAGVISDNTIPKIVFIIMHELGHYFTKLDDIHKEMRMWKEEYSKYTDEFGKNGYSENVIAYHNISWESRADKWMLDHIDEVMDCLRLRGVKSVR